jgi:lipopolysaccharide transport system permease protein
MNKKHYQELIIEAGHYGKNYWRELWHFRELLYVLAKRDITLRYKQTIVGLGWALVRPFFTMVVFTVVFGNIAKLPSDSHAPYALMVFAGLLPWQLFSSALIDSSSSLISNAGLISKVYFPRIIFPISSICVALIDFFVSFIILAGLMIWYKFLPSYTILTLPFFILMAILASLGPGLWIGSLNVKYRDFRYIIPFLLQIGLYISPVGFSTSIVSEDWKYLYSLNPMVSVIEGFRWAILGGQFKLSVDIFIFSWLIIVFFLWFGFRHFKKTERLFADVI